MRTPETLRPYPPRSTTHEVPPISGAAMVVRRYVSRASAYPLPVSPGSGTPVSAAVTPITPNTNVQVHGLDADTDAHHERLATQVFAQCGVEGTRQGPNASRTTMPAAEGTPAFNRFIKPTSADPSTNGIDRSGPSISAHNV